MPKQHIAVVLCLAAAWMATGVDVLTAQELLAGDKVEIVGDVPENRDISALGRVNSHYLCCSNQGGLLHLLQAAGSDWQVVRAIPLNNDGSEMDLESIACEGNVVYVCGSHGLARGKVVSKFARSDNRTSLEKVEHRIGRETLVRLRLDADGMAHDVDHVSLRPILANDAILQPFLAIPTKENGLDIEGLAARDGLLYIGFRGPVLRGNWALVLTGHWANTFEPHDLRFVNLGGLGIRDLAIVNDGLLILAGPVGDGPGDFTLFHWDGRDCLPDGEGAANVGCVRKLGTIPAANCAPEGLLVLREFDAAYELMVAFDGLPNGGLTRYRVAKSPR